MMPNEPRISKEIVIPTYSDHSSEKIIEEVKSYHFSLISLKNQAVNKDKLVLIAIDNMFEKIAINCMFE